MKLKIEYKEVGRNKFCRVDEVNANTKDLTVAMQSCETQAFDEVQKHLLSSTIELNGGEGDYKEVEEYDVMVGGLRFVGKVIISVIKDDN